MIGEWSLVSNVANDPQNFATSTHADTLARAQYINKTEKINSSYTRILKEIDHFNTSTCGDKNLQKTKNADVIILTIKI